MNDRTHTMNHERILIKLSELETEMKRLGIWQAASPQWVHEYSFFERNAEWALDSWVQFVFIPNCCCNKARHGHLLLPQVKQWAPHWLSEPRMLQLLVELDALL